MNVVFLFIYDIVILEYYLHKLSELLACNSKQGVFYFRQTLNKLV